MISNLNHVRRHSKYNVFRLVRCDPFPKINGRKAVMVSRQDHPLQVCKLSHDSQSPPDNFGGRRFCVECVSRNQDELSFANTRCISV